MFRCKSLKTCTTNSPATSVLLITTSRSKKRMSLDGTSNRPIVTESGLKCGTFLQLLSHNHHDGDSVIINNGYIIHFTFVHHTLWCWFFICTNSSFSLFSPLMWVLTAVGRCVTCCVLCMHHHSVSTHYMSIHSVVFSLVLSFFCRGGHDGPSSCRRDCLSSARS